MTVTFDGPSEKHTATLQVKDLRRNKINCYLHVTYWLIQCRIGVSRDILATGNECDLIAIPPIARTSAQQEACASLLRSQSVTARRGSAATLTS